MVDIGIIDNLSTELQEQLPLLPANKQQFNLLASRIRLVVNKILEQENVAENSLFQRHLEQSSNCLTECLAFMQKFTVSKYRLFWLKNDNYNSWFRGVRQCLLEVVQNLRLEVDYLRLFDVREDEESFNIDLQNNRALKEKITTLLKSFLVHQLNIYELSSTLNVRKSLHVRKKFLCYDELSNDLQLEIAEYNWDQKNDLECCQLLQLCIEDTCILKNHRKAKSLIRCQGQDLFSKGIRLFLEEGYQVEQIVVTWQDQLTFVLKDNFNLGSVQYGDQITTETKNYSSDNMMECFEADFIIMTETLNTLINNLLKIFKKGID